jgi:hypothetical protein
MILSCFDLVMEVLSFRLALHLAVVRRSRPLMLPYCACMFAQRARLITRGAVLRGDTGALRSRDGTDETADSTPSAHWLS